jgi:hypothetical protein
MLTEQLRPLPTVVQALELDERSTFPVKVVQGEAPWTQLLITRPLVDGETNVGERRVLDGAIPLAGMWIASVTGPLPCGAVVANVNGAGLDEPPPPHPVKSNAAVTAPNRRRNMTIRAAPVFVRPVSSAWKV